MIMGGTSVGKKRDNRGRKALPLPLAVALSLALSACANAPGGPGGSSSSGTRQEGNAPTHFGALPASPDGLKGLTALEITAMLGTPTLKRRDQPAEIWQYLGQTCVLDVFLYDEGPLQRVTHAQVRNPQYKGQSPLAPEDCMKELSVRTRKPIS